MRFSEIFSSIPKKRRRKPKVDASALRAVGLKPEDVPAQALAEEPEQKK
jgi:hypothetical protein